MAEKGSLTMEASPAEWQECLVNPFQPRRLPQTQEFSVEDFVTGWVEAIFYSGRRVDLPAKIEIYWRTAEQKAFEQSSSSVVYSVIRETVEAVALKLRTLLDQSFDTLRSQTCQLTKMSQTSSSWTLNWTQFRHEEDPESYRSIYPPVSGLYLAFFKYLSEAARETAAFWSAIYDYVPVKDLRCGALQQSLLELILEVFTREGTHFRPLRMLPVMSLASKCRFVNADIEGSARRMELTRFKEDELAVNLARASARRLGSPEQGEQVAGEVRRSGSGSREGRTSGGKGAGCSHLQMIEQVRSHYLQSYRRCESLGKQQLDKYRVVIERMREEAGQPLSPDSSYEDLQEFEYDGRDQLIDENEQIELEQAHFFERTGHGEISAKLSQSTGVEDNHEPHELVVKNEDLENPPDFVLTDDFIAESFPEDHEELGIHLDSDYHLHRLQLRLPEALRRQQGPNLEKTRKRIAKPHSPRGRPERRGSRGGLQQQKQKLEQYRRQLQKQKEQLLREVELFMKEKEKDTQLYHSTCAHLAGKCNCRQPQPHQRHDHDPKPKIPPPSTGHQSGQKLSKRQQKQRRRMERKLVQLRAQQDKRGDEAVSEQETQLVQLLGGLSLSQVNRVPCRVEQHCLEGWRARLAAMRSSVGSPLSRRKQSRRS